MYFVYWYILNYNEANYARFNERLNHQFFALYVLDAVHRYLKSTYTHMSRGHWPAPRRQLLRAPRAHVHVHRAVWGHKHGPALVWRSHTFSETGEGLVYLASRACARLPDSGKSNQIAEKSIITFHAYVT